MPTLVAAGMWLNRRSEIAVCRNQCEVVSGRVVQNFAIAGTSKSVSKRTFGFGERVAQQVNQLWR